MQVTSFRVPAPSITEAWNVYTGLYTQSYFFIDYCAENVLSVYYQTPNDNNILISVSVTPKSLKIERWNPIPPYAPGLAGRCSRPVTLGGRQTRYSVVGTALGGR